MADRLKLLLVDDDKECRRAYQLVLDDLGFDVKTACEGEEALHVLDGHTPDVIMLDLRMPGMDGWQFLDHYGGPVPVVVASAYWDNKPLPREPFALMSKPMDMREVAVVLRQAARSWGKL